MSKRKRARMHRWLFFSVIGLLAAGVSSKSAANVIGLLHMDGSDGSATLLSRRQSISS